jgi:hypothetical protein
MTVSLNLPLIASICAALAGVAGSILTPLYGADLTTAVQGVLQSLSSLLLLIPTLHASSVAATAGKMKVRAKYESGEWLKAAK